MGNQSRYVKVKTTPLPKKKRVRKLFGSQEDTGKFFKCWNCGFINSTERNVGFDGNGILVTDYIENSSYDTIQKFNPYITDLQKIMIGLDSIKGFVMIKNGLDGNPITTYYTQRKVESVKGCAFCGITNIY